MKLIFFSRFLESSFALLLLFAITGSQSTSEEHLVKRESAELLDSYDFVIAGGGTCGLTVADRLTEAFPDKTVLVIEYGDIEDAPGIFDPPTKEWTGLDLNGPRASKWSLTSLPSPALNNATASVRVGKVVGGSSAVNGMFFDRGSRFDFDAWSQLQPTMTDRKVPTWDWKGIFPFFQKSVTYTPPSDEQVELYGFTYDLEAYGNGTTPIYATMSSFAWRDMYLVRQAWEDMGITVSKECAGGDKEGICWIPNSQHPITGKRSYAGLGHYQNVVEGGKRKNYHMLVRHQAVRVVYSDEGKIERGKVPLVEVRSVRNATHTGRAFNITAKAEVIVSAGAFGSPAILQRSGIGPAEFLKSAGLPVILNLPGVGSNLQDHSGPSVQWNYSKPLDMYPLPSDMADEKSFADALAAFDERPARGPYTVAMSMSSIWVPLQNITANYSSIIDRIHNLADVNTSTPSDTNQSISDLLYLPPSYASSPSLIYGYRAQLGVIADLLANPRSPSLESPTATGASLAAALLHPLSRGTVRVDPSALLDLPILDYRSASNPIDIDLHLEHLSYLRRITHTPTMGYMGDAGFVVTETAPGEAVQTDEEMVKYTRNTTQQSFMHPCCTNAMMPEEKGGVVGTDLKVHGAGGRLRVVDASIFPILISAHLSGTAYAVAEKAADIIIKEWSEGIYGHISSVHGRHNTREIVSLLGEISIQVMFL